MAAASNVAPVTGIDGNGVTPHAAEFVWWSDDDDLGRPSEMDDDSGAPAGDFGDDDEAVVVGDGAPTIPLPPAPREAGGEPVNVGGVIGEEDTGTDKPADDAAAIDCA